MNADVAVARARDAEAREFAQRCFDIPVVLEAGAGTGKTSALISRVLAWCLGPGWERALARVSGGPIEDEVIATDVLSRVVAITFTEAAAAEMAARAAVGLSEVEAGNLPPGLLESAIPEDRGLRCRRARALRLQLDAWVVQTIHGFCRRLLARHPLEAGLVPGFTVDAEGRVLGDVVHEVVERAVVRAYASERDDPLITLADLGVGPVDLEQALLQLCNIGASGDIFEPDPLAIHTVSDFFRSLALSAAAVLAAGGDGMRGLSAPVSKETAHALDDTAAFSVEPPPADLGEVDALFGAFRPAWTGRARQRVGAWAKGNFKKGEETQVGEGASELTEASKDLFARLEVACEIDPRRLDAMRRALGPLLDEVRAELARRGSVDFSGLLGRAHDLLRDHVSLAARLREQIDQLLVDEFQDTNGLQCEIVRLLALSGNKADRPGLFLVGDPKQSIYGWRGADLRAYHGFVTEVVDQHGGRLCALHVNFRSAPAILDEVERVFSQCMREQEGVQPPFQPLVACEARAESTGFERQDYAPVEHWVSWAWDEAEAVPVEKTRAPDALRLESQAVAAELRRLHDDFDLTWSSAAILLRSATDLDAILTALRENGVPYVVAHERSYYQRREIVDAAAAARCVLDPNDTLALVAWLRSPAVGVPDAALLPLWQRQIPARVAALGEGADADRALLDAIEAAVGEASIATPRDLPGAEESGWELSLLAALEALAILRVSVRSDPPDRFVETMRRLLVIEPIEASRHLGAYRGANLARFYRELAATLAAQADLDGVARQLRSDIAAGREVEVEALVESEDAVQVMTIHGAKGLDFDHVYLMQTQKTGSNQQPSVEVFETSHGAEYRVLKAETLGYRIASLQSEEVAQAERVRTLYVAMTRARERVVLAGVWPKSPPEIEGARSHADLLAARRPEAPDLADAMSQMDPPRAPSRPIVDAAETRWLFPARAEPTMAAASKLQHRALHVVDMATVEKDVARLQELSAVASQRMARTLGAPASASGSGKHPAVGSAPSSPEFRDAAMLAGTLVHRVLEDLDLSTEAREELARQKDRLPELAAVLGHGDSARGLERARSLLDDLASGPFLERLYQLRDRIVARELPLLLPVRGVPGGGASLISQGPLAFVSGTVDLIYRDPGDDCLVVVDYKTDRVRDADQIRELARYYSGQCATYVRALREGLDLPQSPRAELWFIAAGQCVPVGRGSFAGEVS